MLRYEKKEGAKPGNLVTKWFSFSCTQNCLSCGLTMAQTVSRQPNKGRQTLVRARAHTHNQDSNVPNSTMTRFVFFSSSTTNILFLNKTKINIANHEFD